MKKKFFPIVIICDFIDISPRISIYTNPAETSAEIIIIRTLKKFVEKTALLSDTAFSGSTAASSAIAQAAAQNAIAKANVAATETIWHPT